MLEEFYKQPSDDEITKDLDIQLCHDAQMNDDQIDDFVESIMSLIKARSK